MSRRKILSCPVSFEFVSVAVVAVDVVAVDVVVASCPRANVSPFLYYCYAVFHAG